MTIDESSAAFNEGQEHGRFEENGAGDCPYMPGQAQTERDEWMAGFSRSRAEVEPFPADEGVQRLPDTPADADRHGNISDDPAVALDDIQALIAVFAPRVRGEMIDGDTRIQLHGVMSDGTEVNAEVDWRELSEADFSMLGKELAAAYTARLAKSREPRPLARRRLALDRRGSNRRGDHPGTRRNVYLWQC